MKQASETETLIVCMRPWELLTEALPLFWKSWLVMDWLVLRRGSCFFFLVELHSAKPYKSLTADWRKMVKNKGSNKGNRTCLSVLKLLHLASKASLVWVATGRVYRFCVSRYHEGTSVWTQPRSHLLATENRSFERGVKEATFVRLGEVGLRHQRCPEYSPWRTVGRQSSWRFVWTAGPQSTSEILKPTTH